MASVSGQPGKEAVTI